MSRAPFAFPDESRAPGSFPDADAPHVADPQAVALDDPTTVTSLDLFRRERIGQVIRDGCSFLRHFIRDPQTTGAIAPSSPALAAEIVSGIDLRRARTIVELGAGTGSFTRAILRQASPEALILSMEINQRFAAVLSQRFRRVRVVVDSAENIGAHLRSLNRDRADCIVSGLPWAGFGKDLQRRLLSGITESLAAGGFFTTFAYVHAAALPAARRFREQLLSAFATVSTSPVVWRNLPPAFVYRCSQ